MGATTTVKDANTIRDPDESPEVKAARAALDPLIQCETELRERTERYTSALDRTGDSGGIWSERLVLEAEEQSLVTRVAYARAKRERKDAEARWQQARQAARDRLRETFQRRKRALVGQLAPVLQQAADISRQLAAVEDQQRTLVGDWSLTGLAWFELASETPTQGSRIDDWRRAAVQAGLLDEVAGGQS
jgi:hypothetical protein